MAVLFAGISAAISYQSSDWRFMWLTAIPMVLKTIELVFSTDFVVKLLLRKVLPWIEQTFEKRLPNDLGERNIPIKMK